MKNSIVRNKNQNISYVSMTSQYKKRKLNYGPMAYFLLIVIRFIYVYACVYANIYLYALYC